MAHFTAALYTTAGRSNERSPVWDRAAHQDWFATRSLGLDGEHEPVGGLTACQRGPDADGVFAGV